MLSMISAEASAPSSSAVFSAAPGMRAASSVT